MTALIVIGCVFLSLFLIGLIRVGGMAEYSAEGILVKIKVGPLWVTVFPPKEKEKKPKKKKKKEDKPREDKPKQGGALKLVMELIPLTLEAVGKFIGKIRIDLLTLHLTWATGDPANTALGYGAASAALGAVLEPLERSCRVRRKDLRLDVDFTRTQPVIYAKAALTLTIGQIVALAVHYGVRALIIWLKGRKNRPNPSKKKEAVTHE